MTTRIVVVPDQLNMTADRFVEKDEELSALRTSLTAAVDAVGLNRSDPHFSIGGFYERFTAVELELGQLAATYRVLGAFMTNSALAAQAADAVDPSSGTTVPSIRLPTSVLVAQAQALTSEMAALDSSSDDPRLRVMARSRLGEERRAIHDQLGLNDLSLSPAEADELVARIVVGAVPASGSFADGDDGASADKIALLLARQLAEAGAIDSGSSEAGDTWLGTLLADFMTNYDGYDADAVSVAADAVAERPDTALAFYQTLGLSGTAMLMSRADPALATDTASNEQAVASRQGFATGLATATRAGDIGFGGDELMATNDTALMPGGRAANAGYLFDTDARFASDFASSAAATELRSREGRAPHPPDDRPIVYLLEAVIIAGPETTAQFVADLGPDINLLFRPTAPITAYDPDDQGLILDRLLESLNRSNAYRDDRSAFVVYHAGTSAEPLSGEAIELVERELVTGLAQLSRNLVAPGLNADDNQLCYPDQPYETDLLDRTHMVNAVTAVYRSDSHNLVAAEAGVLMAAVDTALDNGPLTSEQAYIIGTNLEVLQTGRHNASILKAREADQLAEFRGTVAGLAAEAVLGAVAPGGSQAAGAAGSILIDANYGMAADLAVGTVTDGVFYTERELDAVFARALDKNNDQLQIDQATTIRLAETGRLWSRGENGELQPVNLASPNVDNYQVVEDFDHLVVGDPATEQTFKDWRSSSNLGDISRAREDVQREAEVGR